MTAPSRSLDPRKNSLADLLRALPLEQRMKEIAKLSDQQAMELLTTWRGFWARPSQLLPGTPGAEIQTSDWRYWIAKAGRGWGKTKVGSETVREWAEDPKARILLVGPTTSDVRGIMVEGPSGLLSCYPPGKAPLYNSSKSLILFPSGAVGITRTAEEPERLRGPQFTKFWVDELCAMQYAEEMWEQLSMGFRLKTKSLQGLITTTPKPIDIFKKLLVHPKTVITGGSSYENRTNLADAWYEDVIVPYLGTRLGRQEIFAELLDDVEGALWNYELINRARVTMDKVPRMARIVVAIDPSTTSKEKSDECGIGVAGLGVDGHLYVFADYSLKGTPLDWGKKALWAWGWWRGDKLVAETNNGGDLVEANLRGIAASQGVNPAAIPYRSVHASRGKEIRAEPAVALYERGIVHHVIGDHVGSDLKLLEDQMCSWVPGLKGQKSPDRMDWLVWALFDLMIQPAEMKASVSYHAPQVISRY